MASVYLAVRVGTPPLVPVAELLANATSVFAQAGINVDVDATGGVRDVELPRRFSVGYCGNDLTDDQVRIFSSREGLTARTVLVCFFERLARPYAGCARSPEGKPGLAVARNCSKWTLAHELGHLLGLEHVDNPESLMFQVTKKIESTLPTLDEVQIARILESPLVGRP